MLIDGATPHWLSHPNRKRVKAALASYAVATAAALIIASVAFVAHRNRAFAERELDRARAAATAVARGRTPLRHAIAHGIVAPVSSGGDRPYLRQRAVEGRVLGGPSAPATDKLLFDAAVRAERIGSFARFAADGSGRVIAAQPSPRGADAHAVAVVVSEPPTGPAPFPFLVFFGLLALGAGIAAVGSNLGQVGRSLALAVGASGLAVPTWTWGGPIAAGAISAVAVLCAAADARGSLRRAGATLARHRVAYLYLAPAAIGMTALVAVPFVTGLLLGFYDHHRGEWTYVGLDNFAAILSGSGRAFDDPLNFWFTLGVTIAWTALNVALHLAIGVALALALRQPWLRCRGGFRVLLILPWAIPNYITALIWRGMFQSEYGAINALLASLGLDKVAWLSSWSTAFAANVTTNTWLGFPFMMVVALGALESIPRAMYEAAEVDGASAIQRFWHITMPHLRVALGPAVALGAIWTFNMFNVIYLVSNGRPGGSTDILITEAYRWAFERGERYGMAAAYATLILLILVVWTTVGSRVQRRANEARP